ncbi:MAG TPA: hypothetical protein VKT30_10080 [Caulobacteraceae bacterium]|nr:hypothetical protein [Caulobacteraceae bacterium]
MAFWSLTKQQPDTQPADPAATMDSATLKAELGHAFDRGRLHERTRRTGRSLIAVALVILAAVGVMFLGLGARDGSFKAAGADVDQTVAQAMASVGQTG